MTAEAPQISMENAGNDSAMCALYAALAQAQGEYEPIEKNSEGQDGNRKFKYADLAEIIKKTRPALSKHGIAVIQYPETTEKGNTLKTMLVHKDGACICAVIRIPEMGDLKKFGGAVSYLRRYVYQPIVGVSADDDIDNDADSGSNQQNPAQQPSGQKPAVEAPRRRERQQLPPTEHREPATDTSGQCTEGEFKFITARINEFYQGNWEQAYKDAGLDFVPNSPVTKNIVTALRKVL